MQTARCLDKVAAANNNSYYLATTANVICLQLVGACMHRETEFNVANDCVSNSLSNKKRHSARLISRRRITIDLVRRTYVCLVHMVEEPFGGGSTYTSRSARDSQSAHTWRVYRCVRLFIATSEMLNS